jgi:hypothetical protein
LPCDYARTFAEAKAKKSTPNMAQTDSALANEKLKGIRGHIVLIPHHFLEAEDLLPKFGTAEALVPTVTFT